MEDIAVLEAKVREANTALGIARDVETHRINRKLIGKYFKFRNNYSCPEKPSDYWWLYMHVVCVDAGEITVHEFEIDKRGVIRIDFKRTHYWPHGPADGYRASTAGEFNKAWRALKKKIAAR